MNVIQFKKGSRFTGSAEPAHKALEILRKKNGVLRPKEVVEKARNSRSKLHKYFMWDDTEAAQRFREEQARLLIRSIEVIYIESPNAVAVNTYQVVTEPTESDDVKPRKVYTSTAEALADPVMRGEILGNAIRDALSFRRKYAALQELSQVFTAVDAMVEKFKLG